MNNPNHGTECSAWERRLPTGFEGRSYSGPRKRFQSADFQKSVVEAGKMLVLPGSSRSLSEQYSASGLVLQWCENLVRNLCAPAFRQLYRCGILVLNLGAPASRRLRYRCGNVPAFVYTSAVVASFGLVCIACGLPSSAQEHHWEGHGHHHRGGFGNMPGASGFVPSIVADVLLVPSLTKPQQAKVRMLYLDYRAKSMKTMELMRKMHGDSSGRHGRDDNDPPSEVPRTHEGWSGASKSRSSESQKSSAQGDGKRRSSRRDAENSMDNVSSNLRRTMFSSMMKEHDKFQQNVIAVLTEKQHAELKELAKKAGSPDYFAINHYDIMNAD